MLKGSNSVFVSLEFVISCDRSVHFFSCNTLFCTFYCFCWIKGEILQILFALLRYAAVDAKSLVFIDGFAKLKWQTFLLIIKHHFYVKSFITFVSAA